MFLTSEKIYNVFEKPESPEPTDRVVLLREGFSIWAFVFGVFWLIAKRQWVMLAGFIAALIALRVACSALDLPPASIGLLQIWLQLMLAYHANDLRAYFLNRNGYRFAGVLAAESQMHAQRRYYEFAA